MLAFNCSPFHHSVQEVNEIWYPGRAIIRLPSYQISLTSCTKWRNDDQLKVSIWSKLFCRKLSLFENYVTINRISLNVSSSRDFQNSGNPSSNIFIHSWVYPCLSMLNSSGGPIRQYNALLLVMRSLGLFSSTIGPLCQLCGKRSSLRDCEIHKHKQ